MENTLIDEYKLVRKGRDMVKRGYIFYRAWTIGDDKIISFWNESKDVIEDYDNILNHIYKFKNILPDEFRSEFSDNFGQFVDDPRKVGSVPSNEDEIDDLIKKQHIDPKAKEKLKDLGMISPMKVRDEPEWKKQFNESPDAIYIGDDKVLDWRSRIAYTGMYDTKTKILYITYNESDKHSELFDAICDVYVNNKDRDDSEPISFEANGEVNFKILHSNLTDSQLRKHFVENTDIKDIETGGRQMVNKGYILFRLWAGSFNIISCWNNRNQVAPHMEDILKNIKKHVNINTDNTKWEVFGEPEKFTKTKDFVKGTEDKDLTKDEIEQLMKIQHLDPRAKKALMDLGINVPMKVADKPEWQKEFNEGLIKESPDAVDYVDSDGNDITLWYDDDEAIPFIYDVDSDVGFLGENGRTHGHMKHGIRDLIFQRDQRVSPTTNWVWAGGYHIGVSHKNLNAEETLKIVRDKIDKMKFDMSNGSRGLVSAGYILGRVWPEVGVVSFWNKKADVIKHISGIEYLMDFAMEASNILTKDMEWEFIDDQGPKRLDADSNAENSLSDEEYKTLLAKQHLDPKAKEELLNRGLIGAGKARQEPEWNKPFNESMKLTKILEELLVETKETYEVENVFLNGKRVGGITMASSDKQALSNIIIRNLPENLRGTIGIKIADAKKIGGYKIKKLSVNPTQPTTNRLPYRDD
jgi:uncharacterized protein YuzE